MPLPFRLRSAPFCSPSCITNSAPLWLGGQPNFVNALLAWEPLLFAPKAFRGGLHAPHPRGANSKETRPEVSEVQLPPSGRSFWLGGKRAYLLQARIRMPPTWRLAGANASRALKTKRRPSFKPEGFELQSRSPQARHNPCLFTFGWPNRKR